MSIPIGPLSIFIDPAFWGTALGAEFGAVLPDWIDRGWVTNLVPEGARQAPLSLAISEIAWTDLSLAAAANRSQDEQEALKAHASVLLRVAGVPEAKVLVGTSAFIGADDLHFSLDIELVPIAPPRVLHLPEAHVVTSPDLLWFQRRVEEWNGRDSKSRVDQLRFLDELRTAATAANTVEGGACVSFTEHLSDFKLVSPERVSLRWENQGRERANLSVTADAIFADGTREQLNLAHLDSHQPLISAGEKRSILLDSDTDAIVRNVRANHRNRSPRTAAAALLNPTLLVPEGISAKRIDLSEYSNRVLGFVPVAKAGRPEDVTSSGCQWLSETDTGGPFLEIRIDPGDAAAAHATLRFQTLEEAREFEGVLRSELSKPSPAALDWKGIKVLPSRPLLDHLAGDLSIYASHVEKARVESDAGAERHPRLAVELAEDVALATKVQREAEEALPHALLDSLLAAGTQLKEHQRAGVAWLWKQHKRATLGVLLADEMGLGKTLQVACFLALQRHLAKSPKPALVVAPLLLLENWQAELRRFLTPEAVGDVLTLHGGDLRQLRAPDGALDRATIAAKSIVLTNYDTLDRYQQSLLAIDWATVVLDEAQNIKNPDTLRSRAARALKRDFAICSTGTPVENRLADLWTLFDFLSPQHPFGSRKDFVVSFPDSERESPRRVATVLHHPSPDSQVLRRMKSEVLDLPPKSHQLHLAEMTAEQMRLEQWVTGQRSDGTDRAIFEVLNSLRALYQHPWLLRPNLFGDDRDGSAPDTEAICAASPKLAMCVGILEQVREAGEKALIFTPWTKMQLLLVHVLRKRLGLDNVHIINGETNQRGMAMRHIQDFSEAPGFNALILSPLAAGAGLNITAANHVIHYGRWWNPAKEDQATDRAHRIGQTRPVQVHFPVLHHQGNPRGGFDVELHDLVERKRAVATDFLSPTDVPVSELADVLGLPTRRN